MTPVRRLGATSAAALLALVLLVAVPGPAAAPADPGPPPSAMASMGDSITRGFNACGFYIDCTSRSFSTGDHSSVTSHYQRIRAVNPQISGDNHNHGRSGAKVDELPAQAAEVVDRGGVDYVTILIGANDACTSSETSMTSVADFRADLDQALAVLADGLPQARVMVISIPDIYHLWDVGRGSFLARTAWSLFGTCQSMLASPTSFSDADVARRDRVRQRVIDYNAELAAACAAYGPNCRFDGNAVFQYPFSLSQVSGWDYFHPNATGQAVLAEVTYQAGFRW
jgi:lysophospholipase L1-like esterase